MPEEQKKPEINLRSEEVQEILTRIPNWLTRWGISVIFGIIILFFVMTWFIKYPDTIKGTAVVTTSEPPVKLVVKSAGEVEQLYFENNSNIRKDQTIATIKSTLSDQARAFLVLELRKIREAYHNNTLDKVTIKNTKLVFGTLQVNFSELRTALKNYQYLVNEDNTSFNIANVSKQISNQKALQQIISRQLNSTNKLIANAESKFKSDKILYEKGVISQMEFFERERTYETTIGEINNLETDKLTRSIEITELEKQLNDLKFNFNERKKGFLLQIEGQLATLENILYSWTSTYQIVSPLNGKLSYLQPISKSQYVAQGKELFAIIPDNQNFIANLKIPKSGYGKVRKGQKVLLKIDNFPSYEYGQLVGKVETVSLIANEENYLVRVKLPQKLETTYHKELRYVPEMSGTAEIITEDLRIIDRIFNQFRKIFDR